MSRVNIDAQAYLDARFERLARILGLADGDHALAKMSRVWLECTNRETDLLRAEDIYFALRLPPELRSKTETSGEVDDVNRVANALVECELAELNRGRYRIRGCVGRTEWLGNKRKAGKLGGKKGGRPKKAETDSAFPENKAEAKQTETPPAPAPAPAPAHNSSSKKESTPGYQQFIDHFDTLYRGAHGGSKPTWDGKTGSWAKQLLKSHGLEECLRRASNMFEAPPPFPPPPHDFAALRQHFDKFAQPHDSASKPKHAPSKDPRSNAEYWES